MRLVAATITAAGCVVLLAACGGSGSKPTPSSAQDPELQMAECFRGCTRGSVAAQPAAL
jgi:hypothetical protein